jgi:hypothetical protein
VICFRAHDHAHQCRGKVVEICCPKCDWKRALCAAACEGPRRAMVLSAHNRVAHTAQGKAHLVDLQRRGAAARDGRPKHRKTKAAKAKAAAPERKPATSSPPAVDRRKLIAQRMKVSRASASRQVCLICQKPGHNARTCPRRRAEVDEAGEPRPAMGALDVEGLEELESGHDVKLRASGVGVED